MDKAKILRLCNEIEDVACDIARITMNDIVSAESRMIFDKAKEIVAEISAPPKSNGDQIRQMTDEELVMALDADCNRCARSETCELRGDPVNYGDCARGNIEWLKQEVSEDERH